MNPSIRLRGYLGAVTVLIFSTALLVWLRGALTTPLIALLWLLPVGLATARWGLGPGLLSAVVAFLAFNFFFIQPYLTFAVHPTGDVLVLIVFLFVAVVTSQLVGRAQEGMRSAKVREREATQLYELSTALVGQQDVDAIARIAAEHVHSMLQAEHVTIGTTGAEGVLANAPAGTGAPRRSPEARAGLRTGRGDLGEIQVWRSTAALTESDRRLLETSAGQAALALERALLARALTGARVIEESDRLKSALLSSVSHELRTPLATIKAAATSLRSGEVDWGASARTDLLAVIDDETDHLNRLVGNLLEMSRIEAGALRPQRQWNLLSEIVAGVAARLRPLSERHRIESDVPDDLPLVPVDYVQMEQVFTNLIANGLKYSPPETRIRIEARAQPEDMLLVSVSNEGPPVPEAHLDRIFDKFYRVTAADRVTGTGLGLSICRGIVEAHGGRIWAENLPQGFAFRFTLPLAWPGMPPPAPPVETVSP